MCANVDLTSLKPFVKQQNTTFTVAKKYILARTANALQEFCYRIRGVAVVGHEIIHPSCRILVNDDQFSFCTFDYTEELSLFAAQVAE
jgi:chloramphenicol O-acetyltransferase